MDSYLAKTLAIETPRHIFELILSVLQLDQQTLNYQAKTIKRPYRMGEFYPFHVPFGTEIEVQADPETPIQRFFDPQTPIDLYPGVERDINGVFALTQEPSKNWYKWHQIVVNAALLYRKRADAATQRSAEMPIAQLYRTFDARLPEHALRAMASQIYADDYHFKTNPDAEVLVRAYMDGEYYPFHLPHKFEVRITRGEQGLLVRHVQLARPLALYPTFKLDNPDMVAYVSERLSLEWHEQFRMNAIPYLLSRGWISDAWDILVPDPLAEPL